MLIENDRRTLTNNASCLQFYGDTAIASVLLDDPQLLAELKYILKEPFTIRASQKDCWNMIRNVAAETGFCVFIHAADGDSRCISSMLEIHEKQVVFAAGPAVQLRVSARDRSKDGI